MSKNFKFGTCSVLVLASILFGCSDRPAPDPYYVQIRDIQLAIPRAYIKAGSGMDVPRVREEIRKQAASVPGVPIGIFFMSLDSENLKPWVDNPNQHGFPNYLDIWLSNPDLPQRFDMPDIKAKRLMKSDKRLQAQDTYGLTAYEDGGLRAFGGLNYLGRLNDGSTMVISCNGFNMPNPGCEVTASWSGLLLRYRYRHIYLDQWRTMHGRVTELLNSFTYVPSKASK